MQRITTMTVIASLMLSPGVLAQTTTETEAGTETTATFDSFDELSPGNKMIARSLMDAQTLPPDSTIQPWSLDDIAAARAETGWGNVFKQMQAEGLVEANNLGEVVSAHAQATHRPITDSVALEAGIQADTAVGEPAEDRATTEPPENVDGAFDNLSTGNQKIARSLMDAQTLPADGTSEPWTLDQIATAKGETGWGNVFKQMQAEGLVESRNLGQLVSQYQHPSTPATTGTDATLATAATAGSSSTDRLPEQAHDNAAGQADKGLITAAGGSNNNAAGITTAAGSVNGNAYGLNKHTVTASEGMTTANGATVGATNAANNASVAAATSSSSNAAVTATGSTNAASNSAVAESVTTSGGGNGQGYAYGRNR